jgi:tight adherence protein B
MLVSTGMACIGGSMPWLYLMRLRKKRIEKFIAQLPDGVELIGRAMRAGHAFSTGLHLAADEFEDPLGTEFELVVDQINFGMSMEDALKSLSKRMDCEEARFFTVSVLLQRETGGNLAEILEGLANVIRERFKLKDKIRTLSAEGRLSGIGLVCMPIITAIGIYFINPKQILFLIEDPVGRIMSLVTMVMMTLGILIIRKMINFEI